MQCWAHHVNGVCEGHWHVFVVIIALCILSSLYQNTASSAVFLDDLYTPGNEQ